MIIRKDTRNSKKNGKTTNEEFVQLDGEQLT